MTLSDTQIEGIKQTLGVAVGAVERDRAGCAVVWAAREQALTVLRHLKEAEGLEYAFLSDLTAYDDQGTDDEARGRFVIVYNLYSPQNRGRARVKVRAEEGVAVKTAVGLWSSANWAEREVFDMFGIQFEGHPDLRRILLDVRWQGHPLRKDYPIRKYQLFNDPEPIPEHLLKD